MSENSNIEWTDHTFNPWWGCSRVSPGCRFCYADSQASRYGHAVWRRKGPRRMLSDANWAKPVKWNRDAEQAGKPALVFCASMADVFEDHPDVAEPRERLWKLIEVTPWLRWQLLTKRPENILSMAPWGDSWPDHVWIGTSVENQRYADERVPLLLKVPAKVRFLSCEPLVGPVVLDPYWLIGRPGWGPEEHHPSGLITQPIVDGPSISWVIAGGESGPKARPMYPGWPRALRDQCVDAKVPFFYKQHGEWQDGSDPAGRALEHVIVGDGRHVPWSEWQHEGAPVGALAGEAYIDARLRGQARVISRVGKKRAGRELDGRTWDEMPAEAAR
ncbi:phage Gp37/Gp68 family protein [Streptosporangium sp. NPDC048865]|uniref:DUF5131 family protein n=1 Tax=Streptosporangium sp. NPDC048865 TaxID=3155766 RepID=UPI00342737D9